MASEAVAIARDLACGIFPVQLHGLGLALALEELADTTSRQTDMAVSFAETGDTRPTDPADDLHLYRIAQEALSNAAKHGTARHVTIVLPHSDHALRLFANPRPCGRAVLALADNRWHLLDGLTSSRGSSSCRPSLHRSLPGFVP